MLAMDIFVALEFIRQASSGAGGLPDNGNGQLQQTTDSLSFSMDPCPGKTNNSLFDFIDHHAVQICSYFD